MTVSGKIRKLPGTGRALDYLRPRLPYRLLPNPNEVDQGLASLGRDRSFIQIGANDGITADPVYRFARWAGWRGVAVEPSPVPFSRLQRTYRRNPRVTPVMAAVGDAPAVADFFYVEPRPGDPFFTDMVGSFSREHVLRHEIPDVGSRVEQTAVQVRTFDDICRSNGLDRVDLVVLDVEGYDAQLLRTIPFETFDVRAVLYEHWHMTDAERDDVASCLTAAGLTRLFQTGIDAMWTH